MHTEAYFKNKYRQLGNLLESKIGTAIGNIPMWLRQQIDHVEFSEEYVVQQRNPEIFSQMEDGVGYKHQVTILGSSYKVTFFVTFELKEDGYRNIIKHIFLTDLSIEENYAPTINDYRMLLAESYTKLIDQREQVVKRNKQLISKNDLLVKLTSIFSKLDRSLYQLKMEVDQFHRESPNLGEVNRPYIQRISSILHDCMQSKDAYMEEIHKYVTSYNDDKKDKKEE